MKIKVYKIFYVLAIILVIVFVISQVRICYIYPTMFTALRLRSILMINTLEFAVPISACVLVGWLLKRRDKKRGCSSEDMIQEI